MRTLAAIVILALLASACATDQNDGPLVVYSGRSEDLVGPLLERFTEETGIEVQVRYGDSTELAATLILEGQNSNAQVFFSQDPASIGSVAGAGLLAVLDKSLTDLVPARFSDTNSHWVGISGRARTVVYNPSILTGQLPESIWDLTQAQYEGLGIAPTNGSFLAFVAAMILTEGEDRTLEWLQAIAQNNPTTYSGNSPIVAATEIGEVSLGLVNHYYLLRLDAEQGSTVARNLFLASGDAGSLVMPAGIGILNSADTHADDAASLIEFLLSETSQTYFASETYEYPVIAGVSANEGLVPLDDISTPDIDLSRLAEFLDRATELVTEAGLI